MDETAPRTRTASEWREFWRDRGERELAELLARTWPPAREGDATRIATLLGSRAPAEAVAAELGRMRDERRTHRNDAEDETAAAAVGDWFGRA